MLATSHRAAPDAFSFFFFLFSKARALVLQIRVFLQKVELTIHSALAHCSSESCLIIAFMTGSIPLSDLVATADIDRDGAISVLVSQSLRVCVFSFPPSLLVR